MGRRATIVIKQGSYQARNYSRDNTDRLQLPEMTFTTYGLFLPDEEGNSRLHYILGKQGEDIITVPARELSHAKEGRRNLHADTTIDIRRNNDKRLRCLILLLEARGRPMVRV